MAQVTQPRQRRLVNQVLWIVVPFAVIAMLRPWTIRPLESAAKGAFDASAFAATAWPRLVREATQTATDVSEVTTAPGKPRFLRGTGTVAAVERQSRVGILRLQRTGSRPVTVAIQIGPVIRGTALRDASGFIEFSDFTNQFDYAGAANALNDYALRIVLGALPADTLQGRTITFIGAAGKAPVREDGAIEIVPVQLELVEPPGK
jgi:predicted lipoprotein